MEQQDMSITTDTIHEAGTRQAPLFQSSTYIFLYCCLDTGSYTQTRSRSTEYIQQPIQSTETVTTPLPIEKVCIHTMNT